MKKIFTRSFIAVALVAVVGFVSSCKDYNDEIMAEYRGEDAKLEDLIDNLDGLLSDLTTKHNQDIEAAKQAREQMQTTLEGLINTVQAKQALKDNGQSDSIKGAYDSIKDLENSIAKHSDSIKWAVDSIGKLDARIATLEGRVKAIEDLNADNRLKALEDIEAGQRLDSVEKVLGALQHAIGDSVQIVNWASDLKDLQADVVTAKGNHESLTKRLESMQNSINDIKSCAVDCEALDSLVKAMSPKLDSIIKVVNDTVKKDVQKLNRSVSNMAIKVKGLEGDVIRLDTAVAQIDRAYKAADKVLADSIAAVRADLTELEKRVKANEDAIDSLTTRMDELEDALKKRISNVLVQGAYSPVVGYFNMPLGIKSNILAAYKGAAIESIDFPFTTSENMFNGQLNPLYDLKSVLGGGETITKLGDGYAGKLYLTINPAEVDLTDVDFALVNSANALAPVELATPVETSDVLKFGYTRAGVAVYEAEAIITDMNKASVDLNLSDYKDILNDLKEGNVNLADIAGTLYSSVNEIADANAVRASWTDSLGEHTVYSDFAVAAVAVKPLSFSFMYGKEIQNIPGVTRVHNFIDKAFDKVNSTIENSLPSFEGLNFTAPKIEKIEIKDFDELGVNTKITIKDTVEYTLNMEIPVDSVEIPNLSGSTTSIEVPVPEKTHSVLIDGKPQTLVIPAYKIDVPSSNFTVNGTKVSINNVKVNKLLEIPIEVKYDMEDIVEDLYGSVTEPIEDVNKMLGDLEAFMGDVNKMLDELKKVQDMETSIKDAMDDIKGQLHSYLDKLNNKLCSVINSVNDKLQPAMFVKTTDSFGVLSQSKNMPTVIENGAVLVPTTYTAELLAPAFKKYVAITAVDGSTANLAAVNTGDLNKVLDGSVRAVEFNGESGKTYEVSYAALDYDGNVSTVKYYVTVK